MVLRRLAQRDVASGNGPQPVAVNIGNLQVELGIDVDGNTFLDPVSEWDASPTLAEALQGNGTVAMRLTVLGRTPFEVPDWTEPARTFAGAGNMAVPPAGASGPRHAKWRRMEVAVALQKFLVMRLNMEHDAQRIDRFEPVPTASEGRRSSSPSWSPSSSRSSGSDCFSRPLSGCRRQGPTVGSSGRSMLPTPAPRRRSPPSSNGAVGMGSFVLADDTGSARDAERSIQRHGDSMSASSSRHRTPSIPEGAFYGIRQMEGPARLLPQHRDPGRRPSRRSHPGGHHPGREDSMHRC